MSRKIVIVPAFASSHFLKCWIPNMISALDPDIIIINEGLFPNGPENKGHIDERFKDKYCFEDSNVGFDISESFKIKIETEIKLCHIHGIPWKPNIIINPINYFDVDVNQCFLTAISNFGFEPEVGDIIFPLEPDAFLLEVNKEIIQEEISKLKPGQGLKCLWRDLLQTQYYCEAINEVQPKVRRFCYCFDNMENYKRSMDGFMQQDYPFLRYTDKFWIRHYPWFVFDKWKELRYELIWRNDPKYWQDFEIGLQEIKKESMVMQDLIKNEGDGNLPKKEILIRPTRQDQARWARFINVEHPNAIKNHPNFVK